MKQVLIGDDQFEENSIIKDIFQMQYEDVLCKYQVTYTNDSEEMINLAQTKKYDILMIDLRWGQDKPLEGYNILEEVKNCASVRILWTSEDDEARELGYQHGATNCISKRPCPEELEKILKGE